MARLALLSLLTSAALAQNVQFSPPFTPGTPIEDLTPGEKGLPTTPTDTYIATIKRVPFLQGSVPTPQALANPKTIERKYDFSRARKLDVCQFDGVTSEFLVTDSVETLIFSREAQVCVRMRLPFPFTRYDWMVNKQETVYKGAFEKRVPLKLRVENGEAVQVEETDDPQTQEEFTTPVPEPVRCFETLDHPYCDAQSDPGRTVYVFTGMDQNNMSNIDIYEQFQPVDTFAAEGKDAEDPFKVPSFCDGAEVLTGGGQQPTTDPDQVLRCYFPYDTPPQSPPQNAGSSPHHPGL